jgi:hypothetical protein
VRAAADVAFLLHPVEQPRHGRLLDEGGAGEPADAHGRRVGQRREDAPLGNRQALAADDGVEFRGDQVARLRQQRGEVAVDERAPPRRRFPLPATRRRPFGARRAAGLEVGADPRRLKVLLCIHSLLN